MNKIKEQILLYKMKKMKLQKQKDGKFSLFDTSFGKNALKSDIEMDLLLDWDRYCNITPEVGKFLDELASNPRNSVAIHRTKTFIEKDNENNYHSKILDSISKSGLKNGGHLMSSAAYSKVPNLGLTLSPFVGLSSFLQLIGSYKDNNVVVIYSFPSNLVDKKTLDFKNKDAINKIYDFNSEVYVKPEYMIGAIIKNSENNLDEFFTRDEILEMNSEKIKNTF